MPNLKPKIVLSVRRHRSSNGSFDKKILWIHGQGSVALQKERPLNDLSMQLGGRNRAPKNSFHRRDNQPVKDKIKKIASLLSVVACSWLSTSCDRATPQNYFDLAVLNCNLMHGFAGGGLQRELEIDALALAIETNIGRDSKHSSTNSQPRENRMRPGTTSSDMGGADRARVLDLGHQHFRPASGARRR